MKPTIPLRKAISDPLLLGNILAGDSWKAWRTLLIASAGEALDDDERRLFKQFTNRDHEPGAPVEEFVAVKGRRAGGSRSVSVLAAYWGGLCKHPTLVPGERGVLLIIAADQRQADVILDYTEANFRGSPILSQLIASRTARELHLTNGIDIEVRAADFRRLRGLTMVGVIADEVAFWMTDNSANPDSEILNAVRPGLATTGGPLFMISSPFGRKGELWRVFKKHYGSEGDPLILVAKGSSRDFNPTLKQSVVDRAIERDPGAANSEYLGEFRTDVENLFSQERVMHCTLPGVYERSPMLNTKYYAFVDPSGGSSDSFALAVGHYDWAKTVVVLDAVKEVRAPLSPELATIELVKVLNNYQIDTVTGDHYAGEYPAEQFQRCGIRYERSEKNKSELYTDLLPLVNSRRIELLDHPRLIAQLTNLERKTGRGGKDSVDHPQGEHDDAANAVAGLAQIAYTVGNWDTSYRWFNGDPADNKETPEEEWQRHRRNFYYEFGGLIDINMR